MRPQHLCYPSEDGLEILHIASNSVVGYARASGSSYEVDNEWGEKIAVAHSLGEIIPVFLHYNEKHPAAWREAGQGSYSINTHFGDARVEQDQSGSWVAYRNGDYRLLRDGEPARFATAEEAQRAVDIHLGDGLPNFKEVKDGLSWDHDPLLEFWSQLN